MDTDSEAPELAHKTRIIETVTRGTVSEAVEELDSVTFFAYRSTFNR